ncbi:MAG: hypothetical protein M0T85_08330, partial [Dehalococcoidales bacterium]|nr:hypothetical protein [Dehalococcoidales bacterium]
VITRRRCGGVERVRGVRTDGGLPPPFLGMPLVGRYIIRAVVGSGLSGEKALPSLQLLPSY